MTIVSQCAGSLMVADPPWSAHVVSLAFRSSAVPLENAAAPMDEIARFQSPCDVSLEWDEPAADHSGHGECTQQNHLQTARAGDEIVCGDNACRMSHGGAPDKFRSRHAHNLPRREIRRFAVRRLPDLPRVLERDETRCAFGVRSHA